MKKKSFKMTLLFEVIPQNTDKGSKKKRYNWYINVLQLPFPILYYVHMRARLGNRSKRRSKKPYV